MNALSSVPFAPADPYVTAYVGLGSNLGDTGKALAAARAALRTLPGVLGARFSPEYRTEPQGLRDQPFFANQAGELICPGDFEPGALLEALLALETALGRERSGVARFGPRAIDLDLLLFGNTRMTVPRLTLPHPRMLERAFVLLPLADLAPDLRLPGGMTVREALRSIHYRLQDGVIFQDECTAAPPQEGIRPHH